MKKKLLIVVCVLTMILSTTGAVYAGNNGDDIPRIFCVLNAQ